MRNLIDIQKKQIQTEIKKNNEIISDKIIVFKNVKIVTNFTLGSLSS